MSKLNPALVTFNRGRISRLGLARVDLDRTRLSAEIQTNFVPRTLGSMMLRPGLKFIGHINNSSTARLIPFVRSATDAALLELTSTSLRFWINDSLLIRTPTTAVVTNSGFTATALTGWTDADETGATSEWFTGNYLSLIGTRFARAIRRQTVTSSSGTHGVRFVVERGRPYIKIGSSAGGDDYFEETQVRRGTYSIAVKSTGNFVVEVAANTEYRTLVDSVSVESSDTLVLPTTWASADLDSLRWDQSADVIFLANSSYQQKRIERHSTDSWAVASYEPEDGPFRGPNITNIRLTPSGINGNITLSADKPLFKSGHAGSLWQITSIGQNVSVTVTTSDQYSDSIRVSGLDNARIFDVDIVLAGTSTGFTGTIQLQRSFGEPGSWATVSSASWTSTISTNFDDGLDNQIVHYRIGSGSSWSTGSVTASLDYETGGITGVARIDTVVSATESSASVLRALGSTIATETWQEGSWSTHRGWPSALALHGGRLWWGGDWHLWGSVSDAYESFDPEIEGDSGPVNRSIVGAGARKIRWMASLGRLVIGTDSREIQAKTSSLEEPLTPTNFELVDISSQGSANVQAVKIDRRLMFVQRGQVRVFEIGYAANSLDFESADRSILIPEIGEPGIMKMAVQRQPDTRIHCVRDSTGSVALFISDPAEDVAGWIDIVTGATDNTNSAVEEVAVLPSTVEDAVYYLVRREINGTTQRNLERFVREDEARGSSSGTCIADSHVTRNSTFPNIVASATHLIGSTVVIWYFGTSEFYELKAIALFSTSEFMDTNATPQNTLAWRPDGSRFYVEQNTGLAQYAVPTAWDITSIQGATAGAVSSASITTAESFFLETSGTKLFVFDDTPSTALLLTEHDLSTPWDIASRSTSKHIIQFSAGVAGAPLFTPGAARDDGTRIYSLGVNAGVAQITQYDLQTGWSLASMNSGSSLASTNTGQSPQLSGAGGMAFGPTGSTVYISYSIGSSGRVCQYTLATPWDVTTMLAQATATTSALADFCLQPPLLPSPATGFSGIAWGSSGSRLYASDLVGANVYQFPVLAFTEGTVPSNGLVLTPPSTTVCIGLPYCAWYKTVKLAYAAEAGSALTQRKRVTHLGLIGADLHMQGLEYGPTTDSTMLDPLPLIENGATISTGTTAIWSHYDNPTFELNGEWDTDSRVVLKACAPRPATVLGLVIQMETKEKV